LRSSGDLSNCQEKAKDIYALVARLAREGKGEQEIVNVKLDYGCVAKLKIAQRVKILSTVTTAFKSTATLNAITK